MNFEAYVVEVYSMHVHENSVTDALNLMYAHTKFYDYFRVC